MRIWIYLAAAALLAAPLVWVALQARHVTFDIEPVSEQWLTEKRRVRDDE